MNAGKRARIALVDDEKDFLKLICVQLGDIYDVHCFSRGDDFLTGLASVEPDLLILDINMPIMDGFEVCRRVRQSKHYFLPILFLTASQEENDRLKSVDFGANSCLSKPIEADALRAEIEQILAFQRISSSSPGRRSFE